MVDVKRVRRIIEDNLYFYQYIDKEIIEIRENKHLTKNKDINSWIKSKGHISSIVENEAINNISIDEKILYLEKWKILINEFMEYYKINENSKYKYIRLKYFKRYNPNAIEFEMSIGSSVQWKIKNDIIFDITIEALKRNLIKTK